MTRVPDPVLDALAVLLSVVFVLGVGAMVGRTYMLQTGLERALEDMRSTVLDTRASLRRLEAAHAPCVLAHPDDK
jgi:hypothetical protein